MAALDYEQQNDLHPGIDSKFRNRKYDRQNIFAQTKAANDPSRPRTFGVQKAQKVVSMSDFSRNHNPKRQAKPQIKSFANQPWTPPAQLTPANNTPRRTPPQAPVKKETSVALKGFYALRGISMGIWNLSWTGFLWANIQVPFAILTLLLLGIASAVEKYIANQTILGIPIGEIIDAILDYFGLGLEDAFGLFLIVWGISIAINLLLIGGVVISYLIGRLKPLGGNGEGLKWSFLLLAIICGVIPGLNIFPMVWFYIVVMMRYPK